MGEWSIRKWALKGSNDNTITQKKKIKRTPPQSTTHTTEPLKLFFDNVTYDGKSLLQSKQPEEISRTIL